MTHLIIAILHLLGIERNPNDELTSFIIGTIFIFVVLVVVVGMTMGKYDDWRQKRNEVNAESGHVEDKMKTWMSCLVMLFGALGLLYVSMQITQYLLK